MRLIDADEILKILKEHAKSFIPNYEEDNYEAGVLEGLALAECEVNETPTVEERKHGHWVVTENTYQCQFCQYWDTRKKEQVNGRYVFSKLPNYCPDCGAEMDEVK